MLYDTCKVLLDQQTSDLIRNLAFNESRSVYEMMQRLDKTIATRNFPYQFESTRRI